MHFFPSSAVHPDPETFKADRFLDEMGKYKKVDSVMAFSVGKTRKQYYFASDTVSHSPGFHRSLDAHNFNQNPCNHDTRLTRDFFKIWATVLFSGSSNHNPQYNMINQATI